MNHALVVVVHLDFSLAGSSQGLLREKQNHRVEQLQLNIRVAVNVFLNESGNDEIERHGAYFGNYL